jgi:DNA polymerase/3'-5' exonuclease PolX
MPLLAFIIILMPYLRFSSGKKKFSGICWLLPSKTDSSSSTSTSSSSVDEGKEKRLHRRIDLRFIPYNYYPCGLLYFTGTLIHLHSIFCDVR